MKLKKFFSLIFVLLICVSAFSITVGAKETNIINTKFKNTGTFTSKDGLWEIGKETNKESCLICEYYGKEKSLTLPTKIDGFDITGVSRLDNAYIEHITIPKQYTVFLSYTFESCKNLKTVEFSQDYTPSTAIKRFDAGCFRNCTKLQSVILPNVLDETETYNGKLKRMVAGGELPSSTFAGCKSLTDVSFPENLKQLGNDVFNGCSSIEKIVIPEGVVSIAVGAFANTPSLKTLVLPDSIEKLSGGEFNDTSEDLIVVCNPESSTGKQIQELNEKYSDLTFTTISSTPSDLKGDINRDKKFNINDVTTLQMYLSKDLDILCVNEPMLDFNGDGNINIIDATIMQKTLVGLI